MVVRGELWGGLGLLVFDLGGGEFEWVMRTGVSDRWNARFFCFEFDVDVGGSRHINFGPGLAPDFGGGELGFGGLSMTITTRTTTATT